MSRRWGIRDIIWWMLRIINLTLLVFIAGVAGLLLGTYSGIAELIPEARDLGDIRPGQASRVISADGEILATIATEHREFTQLEAMPEALQNGIIAVEDREFYQHMGVDPRGIMRAVWADLRARRAAQGGSTITMQLARNVYLTPSRTIARKLAELVLAIQLERAYTKPEIMELYLNQIYFGEGAYGVQVASKTYFGKDVSELRLAECALLAGLPKAPERYSPFNDEQLAVDRRNLVLNLMLEQGFIDQGEAEQAKDEPLELRDEREPLGLNTFKAPYFTNYVLREVAAAYGSDAVYRGGLTIHTTLDLAIQQAAEEAVAWGIEAVHARSFNANQVALIALDPRTGAIKAMVGGVDYAESQYNRTVQGGRQAGSAFKAFVYTAAMEQGYTPDSIVNDAAKVYPAEVGRTWTPKNYDGEYHGQVPFREAFSESYNAAAVNVADAVGITAVIETAERMGILHPMPPYLPVAIGASDVSPLEMASAYAVFATRGMRTEPYAIRKIEDAQGQMLDEHEVITWRVLHQRVADQMVDMLTSVITTGTGRYTRGIFRRPAAGKTGTSSDYVDAWFIGFTDELCAGVWVGHDDNLPTGRGGRGKGISGATIPAPVWARFMQKAQPVAVSAAAEQEPQRIIEISASEQGAPEAPAPPREPPESGLVELSQGVQGGPAEPTTRRICPRSALLAGPYCPSAITVTYEPGEEPPREVCDVHTEPADADTAETPTVEPSRERERDRVTLPICAISGKIATPRCPVVRNQTFWLDEAPVETCDQHRR